MAPKRKRPKTKNLLLPPSQAEWKSMTILDAIAGDEIDQESGERIEKWFYVGDDVEALSPDGPENIWVGRIYGIRSREDGRPWVKVFWYYSPSDMVQEHSSFPVFHCGPYERIISDQFDILAYDCLDKVVYVHPYDESSLDPPDIDEEAFYQRYTFHKFHGRVEPDPADAACKECGEAYNPFPGEPSMNPMHFCAKPRCRRWYHRQCLLSNSETIERDPGTYLGRKGIHHLAADPDEEDSHPDFAPFTYKAPPPGLGRGKMSDPAWAEMRWSEIHLTLLAHLPSMLIEVAQHPILRCAGREEYSIAGNVKEVILARRMVYQVLEGWHRFVDEIIESLGSEEAFEDRKLDDLLKVLGPGTRAYHRMSHTRILASPYAPYWERRAERPKKLADAEGIPFLRCPRCTSVV